MLYTIYFRQPATGKLMHYRVEADASYDPQDHEEYHKLAEKSLGVPLKFVLVRVK